MSVYVTRAAAAHLVIEMEQHAGSAIMRFGTRSIGVAAKEEAGKKTGTFSGFADLRE